MAGRATLDKLRRICLAFPEATEQVFGGHTTPTFRVRDKIFVMYHEDRNERGKVTGTSIWCKAPPGAQEILVGSDPDRFYRPPYVGPKGWIGFVLDVKPVDWVLVEDLGARQLPDDGAEEAGSAAGLRAKSLAPQSVLLRGATGEGARPHGNFR